LGIAPDHAFAILEAEVMAMGVRVLTLVIFALASLVRPVLAEEWSQARISRLPDSAFAAVETSPDGRRVRHLPHHDETGALDLPHLKAATSRLGQVKWLDPAHAEIARQHLDAHWRQIKNR
jgi:hypothetical protein